MLIVDRLLKKSSDFHGAERFNTALTRTCHWPVTWACESCPQSLPASLRAIFILVSYLCLSVPNDFFPSDILTKILYAFLISDAYYMACSSYPSEQLFPSLPYLVSLGKGWCCCLLWSLCCVSMLPWCTGVSKKRKPDLNNINLIITQKKKTHKQGTLNKPQN
jgi:hypothetical protein